MNWIKPEDALPAKKDGWNHSEQVLLHYPSTENDIETYGIGYYHYNPPYRKPGFIDFSRSRTPDLWSPIEHPSVQEERDDKSMKEAKGWEDFREGAYNAWKSKNPDK